MRSNSNKKERKNFGLVDWIDFKILKGGSGLISLAKKCNLISHRKRIEAIFSNSKFIIQNSKLINLCQRLVRFFKPCNDNSCCQSSRTKWSDLFLLILKHSQWLFRNDFFKNGQHDFLIFRFMILWILIQTLRRKVRRVNAKILSLRPQ